MPAPEQAQFTVAIKRDGAEGWLATAAYAREGTAPVIEHRTEENPFEAIYNALSGVMVHLGYDQEDEPSQIQQAWPPEPARSAARPDASCCGEPRVTPTVDRCYDHAKVCEVCGQPSETGAPETCCVCRRDHPRCATCAGRGWVTNGGSLYDGSVEQLPCPTCQEGARDA